MDKSENPRKGRIHVMYSVMFLALSTLIFRLGFLQMVHGNMFRTQATTTMLSRLPVLPSRGWVYDSNGVLLAYDTPSFAITMTRLNSPDQDFSQMANELAPVFGMSSTDLLDIMQNKDQGHAQVHLLEGANHKQVAFVQEHQSDLPGVHVEVDPLRAYKYGDLASHVLGYVGKQSQQERPYYESQGYGIDQWVGKDGIERQYESLLQGKQGQRVVVTNNLGVPLKEFGLDPAPAAGQSIQLTLDSALQAQAQQIIVDALQQIRDKHHYNPNEATAVMLNPNDGSVLAMVSYPYYNPQWFMNSKALMDHEKYLWDPKLTPMVNHVIQSRHQPGSTVKPANLLAALQSGVVTPYTVIQDPGYAMVGTYKAHDDVKYGHGNVNPVTAIAVSCDTFFYNVGMWLANWNGGPPLGESVGRWLVTGHVKGLNTLYTWEAKFGLGQSTGVDLPGELKGAFYQNYAANSKPSYLVPYDLQAAQKSMKTKGYYMNHALLYDNAFAAIGQMQQFTPMEIAQYISTLANGGKRIQPHLLKAVYPPGGAPSHGSDKGKGTPQPVKPKILGQVNCSPRYLDIVRRGMYAVVNSPSGTAFGSFYNAPYKAAGKTGTAQVGGGSDDTSVFMAYAPYDHPQVAIAVMVPGGGMSTETAVPIGRALLDTYFRLKHAPFFSQSQWITQTGPPSNWFHMPAYRQPEDSVNK